MKTKNVYNKNNELLGEYLKIVTEIYGNWDSDWVGWEPKTVFKVCYLKEDGSVDFAFAENVLIKEG